MNIKSITHSVVKVFTTIASIVFFILLLGGVYTYGYLQGMYQGQLQIKNKYQAYVSSIVDTLNEVVEPTATPVREVVNTPTPVSNTNSPYKQSVSWGGPDLWESVNSRRIELGVNSLDQRDNLCTIASIRLNELLELGKLDGHEGFTTMTERRPDLAYIFEEYSTVAEFLAAGGTSADETVSLWENSLGHKKVVTGGEYVWGCIYAQDTFAVAITAY